MKDREKALPALDESFAHASPRAAYKPLTGWSQAYAVLLMSLLCTAGASFATERDSDDKKALAGLGRRVRGFIVWESNRTGTWELYRVDTDGSGFRRLTDFAEPNWASYSLYLRPRVSPDGGTVLFAYTDMRGKPCEVWTVPSDGGEARRLTTGNPLRWTPDGSGILFARGNMVWRYGLEDASEQPVSETEVPPEGRNATMVGDVLPDLGLGVFRTRRNEFFDFKTQKTIATTAGCQPRFSDDGSIMYWVNSSRDFRFWRLPSRRDETLMQTPPTEPFDYTYFPTLSADNRWLAYAASPGRHNHFTSDYEVFLQELDGMKPVGNPVRITRHPNTDRWPVLHQSPDEHGFAGVLRKDARESHPDAAALASVRDCN